VSCKLHQATSTRHVVTAVCGVQPATAAPGQLFRLA
jgi:hypothetical protein